MDYNEVKNIFDKAKLANDVSDINFDCLDISNLLNQEKFDKNKAIEKICSTNDKHPDNQYVYNFLFPTYGQRISIGEANEQSLKIDLKWKLFYLNAKSQAKQFDEFIKDVNEFLKKESENK